MADKKQDTKTETPKLNTDGTKPGESNRGLTGYERGKRGLDGPRR